MERVNDIWQQRAARRIDADEAERHESERNESDFISPNPATSEIVNRNLVDRDERVE